MDNVANKIIIRELLPSEYPLIKDFTFISMFAPPDQEPYGIEFLDHPVVIPYHVNFGNNDGDYAVAAEIDGKIAGISWSRIFPLHDYGINDLPVLCMAVLPEYRRMGLGRRTLTKLHEILAKNGYKKIALTVHKENHAQYLYKDMGYIVKGGAGVEIFMIKEN